MCACWQAPVVLLFLGALGACDSGVDLEVRDDSMLGEPVEGWRSVREVASSIEKNQDGHEEAAFSDGLVAVFIPPGEFVMGDDEGDRDERPERRVHLDGYWIGKYPVTVAEFGRFVEETEYVTDAERGAGSWQYEDGTWTICDDGSWRNIYFPQGDDHPVGSVSWNDANAYCAWLSKRHGVRFRLPTEAQWEKAARGVDGRRYPWGDDPPTARHANWNDLSFLQQYGESDRADMADTTVDDGFAATSPVDQYPDGRSSFGIYDMAGNLGEWCHDAYRRDAYRDLPSENPVAPEPDPGTDHADIDRVNRGGAWTDSAVPHEPGAGHSILAAARTGDEQNSSDDHMGFRVCADPNRP